mmetsp:Transcript_23928/g.50049  ORF Transcript_23928/g.50049 Transcript_23928/m.50049 type:complete len:104 (+) Transcript_23928:729-1040(+)
MITTGGWSAGGPSDPSPTQSIAMCTLWSEAAVGGGDHVCADAAPDASMSCAVSGWNAVKSSAAAAGCGAVVTPVGVDGTLEEMLFGRGWEEGGYAFESDALRL